MLNSITICYITCCAVRKLCLNWKKIQVTSALFVLKLKIFNIFYSCVGMYTEFRTYYLLLSMWKFHGKLIFWGSILNVTKKKPVYLTTSSFVALNIYKYKIFCRLERLENNNKIWLEKIMLKSVQFPG